MQKEKDTTTLQDICVNCNKFRSDHEHGGNCPNGRNTAFVSAYQSKPKSEVLSPGVDQIPFESLEALGEIFAEGEVKYGRDNWKKDPGNSEYNAERTRHALRHLFLYANGDRSENHLAKVMWFCCTTIWRTNNSI